MSDLINAIKKSNNLLEVRGDAPPSDKNIHSSDHKLTNRSDLSPKSSTSSPSQKFISLIDKNDESKEKVNTRMESFYGGPSHSALNKRRSTSSQQDTQQNNTTAQDDGKFVNVGIQTSPQETIYKFSPRVKFEIPREHNIDTNVVAHSSYVGYLQVPKVKKVQHFSDVRVAYRRYADMLKKKGFGVPQKLFEITAPPNVKSRLNNETACFVSKKIPTIKVHNLSMDNAYNLISEERNQTNEIFEITVIFPELINTFEEMGKYYIKIDLEKYWKKYSVHFNDSNEIFEFQALTKLLEESSYFPDIYTSICEAYPFLMAPGRKENFIYSPTEIRAKVKVLEQEGLYQNIFDLLVVNFCVSREMNERIMDSLYSEVMAEFDRKYRQKLEVDSMMFLNTREIRTLLEIPLSTDILMAGKRENIFHKSKFATDLLVDFKKDNYYQTIKQQVKLVWLMNHEHFLMDKNMPHTEFKPMKTYINSNSKHREPSTEIPYKYSAVEILGSVRSSTLSYFLNPMLPTYKPGLSAKGNKLMRDYRAKRIAEVAHSRMKKKDRPYSRDALSHASEASNFIPIEPQKAKRDASRELRSADASISVDSKFEDLITKTKEYRAKQQIHEDFSRSLANNSSLRPIGASISSGIGSKATSSEKHKLKGHLNKSMMASTATKYSDNMERKLTIEDNAKILKQYPYINRRDIIDIYTKYLTLAEITARRKHNLETPEKKDKKKEAVTTPHSTANKFTTMASLKSTKKSGKEDKFDPSSVTLADNVDIDILYQFLDFFNVRSENLRALLVKASSIISDPSTIISWENFLNFNVVVLLGKGTKEQKINFLEKLFCPNKHRIVTKEEFMAILRDIVKPNSKFNDPEIDLDETLEQIWRSDFQATGCVTVHNTLISENFRKAMECDKIYPDTFMQYINEDVLPNPSLPTND